MDHSFGANNLAGSKSIIPTEVNTLIPKQFNLLGLPVNCFGRCTFTLYEAYVIYGPCSTMLLNDLCVKILQTTNSRSSYSQTETCFATICTETLFSKLSGEMCACSKQKCRFKTGNRQQSVLIREGIV